ncbi:MAG: tRNA (guanosine(46)-N7)-methyltransferase TrmB, partial [Planctomycetes bacterium]|nr:tRNA (guanosine(46)-N7)-methyltransferase TrmB [Planctomycetota bacterium]
MTIRISPATRALLDESDLEVALPDLAAKGGWGGVFGVDECPAMGLEIGIGKDPHIVERAAAAPERFFVGIEHSKKKLEKVHAKAIRRGVRNLRLLRADIFRILDKVFPDGRLDAAWIFFPDPWPKKRHHKKRMVQHSLMGMLARKLQVGSPVELRTDHADYKDQMVRVIAESTSYRNEVSDGYRTSPLPDRPHFPTLFETKYRERDITIHYL